MTTIQQCPFFKDEQRHTISDEHVFVLIDEGHRTQYGLTAADMRMALPNGVFFAYTGTPHMKKEKTTNVFGDYIDKYKLSEAEADGAVVPIYYSNKFPHLSVDGGETIDTVFDRIFKDKDPEWLESLLEAQGKNDFTETSERASVPKDTEFGGYESKLDWALKDSKSYEEAKKNDEKGKFGNMFTPSDNPLA